MMEVILGILLFLIVVAVLALVLGFRKPGVGGR